MKKRIFLIFCTSFLFFLSCDKLDKDQYLTELPDLIEVDPEPDSELYKSKKVLIAEFTGQRCTWCPGGDEVASGIMSEFNPKVIAIAIHAGGLSLPVKPFTTEYRTQEGTEIYDYYGKPGPPQAVISGLLSSVKPPEWRKAVENALSTSPIAFMSLNNSSVDSISRKIKAKITIAFPQGSSENINLVLAVTEDGIISRQAIDGGEDILDYEHNHVLRQMPFGAFGMEYVTNTKPVNAGNKKAILYEFSFREGCIAKNCNLVAYLINSDTKEILQVEEVAFKNIVK